MLRSVDLGGGLETSLLGFGCANLFREPSATGRRRLLDAAFDAGIRHFDAAPMYGLGGVERELGRFARRTRGEIVVATKFGIAPTSAARALAHVQGPLRRLLGREPRASGGAPRSGAVGNLLYRTSGFDAAAARASLERSLRALGTNHVDLLLLHDPQPADIRSDDVRGYLESARAAGHIRLWGVAGERRSSEDATRTLGGNVPVLQVPGDIFTRPRTESSRSDATILFGVLGRALALVCAHVRADEGRRRRWSEAIGADCGRADMIAPLLLRDAVSDNPSGVVLFSTTRAERIASAARSVDGLNELDLAAFRSLLESDPPPAAQL
jgi:D-threo-aldose 1-dehydrogenase